jgi:transcriptional regulator with XRE-family HTH domain
MLKALGITQAQFAADIGIKQGTVSDIIRGKTSGLSETAVKLCRYIYNINPTWLLTGEGEMFLPSAPLGDREPTPLEQGEEPKPPEVKKRSQNGNHLSALEGGVKEYPDIDDIDQIARTAWYKHLPHASQYIINGLDELRDPLVLESVKNIVLSAVAKERAEKQVKFNEEQLNEDLRKLQEELNIQRESDLRKKGEAG